MLRRLALRDLVLVERLELELDAGFTVLTGETGAGKSILIDALQLALGARADAGLVREGCARAEVSAEFDAPPALAAWLEHAGFEPDAEGRLLLRRTLDAQGRSRAWVNGSAATVAQLREAAEALVDIHGQHAWQSLMRPAAVRALLDAQAGVDTAALAARWQAWRAACSALAEARAHGDALQRERDRLAWQIGELDRLAPGADEWAALEAEHQRLAHAQSLIDGMRAALDALADAEPSADTLAARAADALQQVQHWDPRLAETVEVLRSAQAQLQDAAHSLQAWLARSEPDPGRLAELDARIASWHALARRWRRPAAELPVLLQGWRDELRSLDAAADLQALEQAEADAQAAWRSTAQAASRLRHAAAPRLAAAVSQAMQQLGMAGGRFEVALPAQDEPQPFGLETVEFRVAGHAGSTPRPLARVASGGELSRLALAVAVSTVAAAGAGSAPTLIFDEIDAGVGGSVGFQVGRLLKQLGGGCQVLAVTHLAQVAACADRHFVVSKQQRDGRPSTELQPAAGEARVAEIARMLGGERLGETGRAHAAAMLGGTAPMEVPAEAPAEAPAGTPRRSRR
ncbi:MAG: DNA repair protein RecN [Proteobacteria bacterium]|nr:DNA repair protein RecN [Pseudomonadota bacterium]